MNPGTPATQRKSLLVFTSLCGISEMCGTTLCLSFVPAFPPLYDWLSTSHTPHPLSGCPRSAGLVHPVCWTSPVVRHLVISGFPVCE